MTTDHDLFSTETTGLPGVPAAGDPAGRRGPFSLSIGPVRKDLSGKDRARTGDKDLGEGHGRRAADAGLQRLDPRPDAPRPQGAEITVDVHNDGDVETTVHWHGLRLENRFDGVPHETQAAHPDGRRLQLPGAVP